MTNNQIIKLPTIQDLNNFQAEKIAELKAAGSYNYDSLRAIVEQRDAIVAQETVQYCGVDGTDGFAVIFGTAPERAAKRSAIVLASYLRGASC